MTTPSTQEVLAFLKKTDPGVAAKVEAAIAKTSPGVADVHASTALGNEKPGKKRRRQKPVSATEGIKPHKEGAPDGAVEKAEREKHVITGYRNGVYVTDLVKWAQLWRDPELEARIRDGSIFKETDAGMYDKAEVSYTDTATGADFCGICKNMSGQDACRIVKGVISPAGWCQKFLSVADPDAVPQVQKKNSLRQLKVMDEDTAYAHTPFPWDANVFASMRADQIPRFLSAITEPQNLPMKTVKLRKLTALQDRVDIAKVKIIRDAGAEGTSHGGKRPVVVRMGKGRLVIGDGHHRLTAHWLDGDKKADVGYADLEPFDESVSATDIDPADDETLVDKAEDWGIPFQVKKLEPDKRLIFGFASVAEKNGQLVIDKQDDVMLPADLEQAVYDFVLFAQTPNEDDVAAFLTEIDPSLGALFKEAVSKIEIEKRATMGFMHDKMGMGRVIESMMFTKEKVSALNEYLKAEGAGQIDMRLQGWWLGFYVDDDATWALAKAGKLPEFSIGGRGRRVAV